MLYLLNFDSDRKMVVLTVDFILHKVDPSFTETNPDDSRTVKSVPLPVTMLSYTLHIKYKLKFAKKCKLFHRPYDITICM